VAVRDQLAHRERAGHVAAADEKNAQGSGHC
jgi:hypothetical protein